MTRAHPAPARRTCPTAALPPGGSAASRRATHSALLVAPPRGNRRIGPDMYAPVFSRPSAACRPHSIERRSAPSRPHSLPLTLSRGRMNPGVGSVLATRAAQPGPRSGHTLRGPSVDFTAARPAPVSLVWAGLLHAIGQACPGPKIWRPSQLPFCEKLGLTIIVKSKRCDSRNTAAKITS